MVSKNNSKETKSPINKSYLFIIDHFGSGGAQRQLVTLALALKSKGYQIEFFAYYPKYTFYLPLLENANIPVHWSDKKSKLSQGDFP